MRRIALIACLAAFATAAAAGVSVDPKQAPAGAYQMETRHTQVLFAIPHFGITDYYGRFEKVTGTLNFNPGAPEKSSVSVTIDTASANVMSSQLIGEIVGPSVFDNGQFPTATFTSTSIARTGSNTGRMTGDLTIHGIKKTVVFDVTFNGGTLSPMGGNSYDLGFHATTVIKRSDFGLDHMAWSAAVGDEVKLTIEAMFQQRKS